jgi:predicted PurR-regulated permease PerM
MNIFKTLLDKLKELKSDSSNIFEEEDLATKLSEEDKNKVAENTVTVDFSVRSAVKAAIAVLLVIVLFQFLYDIGYILVLFFVAFLLAAALEPLINKLSVYKVPRTLSVIGVFLVLFVLLGLFIQDVVSIIAAQFNEIALSIGEYIKDMNGAYSVPFENYLKPYVDQLSEAVDFQAAASQMQNAFNVISSQLLSLSFGLFNLLIVLVLTFFMTVEEDSIRKFYLSLFPSRYANYAVNKLTAVKHQIGMWIRGQMMVSLVAAISSYIVLIALGINYALTLSIIAGLAMVIPVVGRVFAWVITFPIVLNQSPALAGWMSLMYLLIQQVENNVLIPIIMKRAVGLSPIIIIFAMMIGNHYLQLLGLIISVPVATTIALFVRDYTEKVK